MSSCAEMRERVSSTWAVYSTENEMRSAPAFAKASTCCLGLLMRRWTSLRSSVFRPATKGDPTVIFGQILPSMTSKWRSLTSFSWRILRAAFWLPMSALRVATESCGRLRMSSIFSARVMRIKLLRLEWDEIALSGLWILRCRKTQGGAPGHVSAPRWGWERRKPRGSFWEAPGFESCERLL
jgi:hypothetical protein